VRSALGLWWLPSFFSSSGRCRTVRLPSVDVNCFVPATPSFISSRRQQAERAAAKVSTSTDGAVCLGVLTGYQWAHIFDEVRQHVSSPLLSLWYLTVLRWASTTSVCNCDPARCSLVVLCGPLRSFAVFSQYSGRLPSVNQKSQYLKNCLTNTLIAPLPSAK